MGDWLGGFALQAAEPPAEGGGGVAALLQAVELGEGAFEEDGDGESWILTVPGRGYRLQSIVQGLAGWASSAGRRADESVG